MNYCVKKLMLKVIRKKVYLITFFTAGEIDLSHFIYLIIFSVYINLNSQISER